MTVASKIDISSSKPVKEGDLLLGEDWESPEAGVDPTISEGRARRGLISLNRSPLARKIIVFNLLALTVLVAGVLFLNPFRDSLVVQRERALVTEAQLVANVVSALQTAEGNLPRSLGGVSVGPGLEVFLFDPSGALVAQTVGQERPGIAPDQPRSTVITDLLNTIWSGVSAVIGGDQGQNQPDTGASLARGLFVPALSGDTIAVTGKGAEGGVIFSVATPVVQGTSVLGVVALASAEGEIDLLVRYEREQILQMFVIALWCPSA
jgi:two-component system sensor histidine kinase ChvG